MGDDAMHGREADPKASPASSDERLSKLEEDDIFKFDRQSLDLPDKSSARNEGSTGAVAKQSSESRSAEEDSVIEALGLHSFVQKPSRQPMGLVSVRLHRNP